MKHWEESWKYDAQQSIFDELQGVSSGDETLWRMLDITPFLNIQGIFQTLLKTYEYTELSTMTSSERQGHVVDKWSSLYKETFQQSVFLHVGVKY